MLSAVATQTGRSIQIEFDHFAAEAESHSEVEPKDGPSPIVPEIKELAWSAGAFIVFAVLMRFVLYPRLKQGMAARYSSIRDGHANADAIRAAAKADVASYEAQVASVKAEANARIEAARRTLEEEREVRLAEANARIAARRESARADAEAVRSAGLSELESAAGDVTERLVELSTGLRPTESVVSEAVSASMLEGAGR
ncbi:MAG: ATP synthase F0 subunit B [Actinomycetota bacterium]|nr:ATP synthase F0 subunit B [Actinomycetota bacterium]